MGRVLAVLAVFASTIVLFAAVLEGGARLIFPEQLQNRCVAKGQGLNGARPNCESQPMKFWEGPWHTYAFNDCGYRSAASCREQPAGSRRVVVMGTSMSNGMFVAYADTFLARTEAALKARCRAPVDVQNLALPGAAIVATPQWHHVLDRMPAALALRPSAIVMVVSSLDLKYYNAPLSELVSSKGEAHEGRGQQIVQMVKRDIATSRAVMAMRSMMYRNGPVYLEHYLSEGDDAAYLYGPVSSKWRMRLQIADTVLGAMADQARQAGVPFIVIYYPTYPQAVAAHAPTVVKGLAPFALADRLGSIVHAHGGQFVDFTGQVASMPSPWSLFYVSNDHPNSEGNRLLADHLVPLLIKDAPAFASCRGAA